MSLEEDYLMAEVAKLRTRVEALEANAGLEDPTAEPEPEQSAANPFAEKTDESKQDTSKSSQRPTSGTGDGRGGGQRKR